MAFKKKKKSDPVLAFLENNPTISVRERDAALNYLVSFVNLLRPKPSDTDEEIQQHFSKVIRLLYEFPASLNTLRTCIIAQLVNSNLVPMFTESGITVSRGVGRELYARLKHKFLPALQDHNDFLYLLDRIFYRRADYKWVETITREQWGQFFELIKLPLSSNQPLIINQAMVSLQILGAGVSQLGWEKEVIRNTHMKWMQTENPFETQQFLIYELRELILHQAPPEKIRELGLRIKEVLQEARLLVDEIRNGTNEKGTSLSQTFILFQIEQKLTRMELLLDIVDADDQINTNRFVDLFRSVVRYENRKNSILEFLSQTTGYVAYQIAEHKGKKGNKYITSSPKEYWAMVASAMSGGLIIVFVAMLKTVLHKLPLAPFWQGFIYSVNYSVGFIAIEETKSTLATKQPAFTASAVAGSLDTKNNEKPNLFNLAVTVSKIFRSQTASFIGNLIIVFPVTWLMAWLYDICFGHPLVGREEGIAMLQDQHPWQSLSLLYAANTGFFLFLSGIIAGYVQNKMNYGKIERRLAEHPVLRVYIAPARLQRIASYLHGHAGSLIGNISLGFFLGMSGLVGKIFGIPFDIRHITISAANTSLGFYGVGWESINGRFLLTVFIGVLFIGFINFLVSFSLAFIVAVRSRGIHLRDYPEFLQILWKYFRSHPLDFFRPRKRIDHH